MIKIQSFYQVLNIYTKKNNQSQILHTIAKQVLDNIDIKIKNNNDQIVNKFQLTQHPFSSISQPIFKPIRQQVKFPKIKFLIQYQKD